MRLRLINEIQYKEPCTNMSRKNIASQYGVTDINDTLHKPTQDPRLLEKQRQRKLELLDANIKRRKRLKSK